MAPFLSQETYPVPEQDILSWYFDKPQYDLNKPVYIDASRPSRSYTGHQAKRTIRQLAAGLAAAGLEEGDCVIIQSFNDIEYPILVNGIVAGGQIFGGVNPSYTKDELVHHIKITKAKMLIVEHELLPQMLRAAKETGIPQDRVLVFDHGWEDDALKSVDAQGLRSWRTLLEHGERDWKRLKGKAARTTTAALLGTSGTTGFPKAAILTHYNFIAQHTLVLDARPRPWEISRLVATPMYHVATVPSSHFGPLRHGYATYIMRRFELELFLKSMDDFKITEMTLVPPIAVSIINSPLSKKYSLKAVRMGTCGAAPLGRSEQNRVQALLRKDAQFAQVWGMTETSCIASSVPWPEQDDTGSVGRILAGLDVRLVDDSGRDITGYDVRGEICVRGPTVIPGYFNNEEANARDWDKDGFFHTGDIAYCDGKSKLWYIVDRKKELIKVRGFQVAPPELESVLLSHPGIVDAAVIGVPHKQGEELPRAYIVRRPDDAEAAKLSEKTVYAYVQDKVAKYKRLDGGICFVKEIPKNPSGKILKRTLRDTAKREMGARL